MSKSRNNLKWFRMLQPTLDALTGAMASGKLSSNDLVIYLLMRSGAEYADGIARMSQKEIAQQTGLGLATVKRSIARLLDGGYLMSHTTAGRTAAYQAADLAKLIPPGGEEHLRWAYVPAAETCQLRELKAYEGGQQSALPDGVTVINNINHVTVNVQINNFAAVTDEQLESMKRMIESAQTPPNMRAKIEEQYTRLASDLARQ